MPESNEHTEQTGTKLVRLGSLDFHYGRNGNSFSPNGKAVIPEEYARLHADIERAASPSRCFVVGITSAVYGEGKTTVALNLAGTIAQNSPSRVTLVDFNLRNWDIQDRLNMSAVVGLVDVLEGSEDDLAAIVQRTEMDNLTIIPAGRAAANPARLVRSTRLNEVISTLKMSSDFIVLDMAPVLPVADTKSIVKLLDGVVMVVRAGVTPREIVARAIDSVGSDKVLGVVLNGVETAMPKWLQRYFS